MPAPRSTPKAPRPFVQRLGSRSPCQGGAAGALALGLAAGALGCEYTPTTTLKVRDPSQVQLEVDDGRGDQTILARGAEAETTAVPAGRPPFVGVFTPPTSVARGEGGGIVVRCDSCAEPQRTVLGADGAMVMDGELRFLEVDWKRKEMELRFRAVQEMAAASASFDASVATPWENVASIRRVSVPNRAVGLELIASAAITGGLGALACIDAASNHRGTSLALGIPALVLTVPLLGVGGWYAFAPAREEDLYPGAKGR